MALFIRKMILRSLFGILTRQTQKMDTGATYLTNKLLAIGHMTMIALSQALGGL
jgi:hypothetical protein